MLRNLKYLEEIVSNVDTALLEKYLDHDRDGADISLKGCREFYIGIFKKLKNQALSNNLNGLKSPDKAVNTPVQDRNSKIKRWWEIVSPQELQI